MKTSTTKQASLPGINANEYALKGLLNECPLPKTFEAAEAFFRDKTDALIKLKKDHDFMRVVLKDTNVEEDKEQHQYTKELSIFDPEERRRGYIELAGRVYVVWRDLQAQKHSHE